MTELSKYISPECNYTIQSIIAEVNRGKSNSLSFAKKNFNNFTLAISEREAKIENIEERQIPKCDNNFYEEFTFLDTVTGTKNTFEIIFRFYTSTHYYRPHSN
jgi:hypothetical protein